MGGASPKQHQESHVPESMAPVKRDAEVAWGCGKGPSGVAPRTCDRCIRKVGGKGIGSVSFTTTRGVQGYPGIDEILFEETETKAVSCRHTR